MTSVKPTLQKWGSQGQELLGQFWEFVESQKNSKFDSTESKDEKKKEKGKDKHNITDSKPAEKPPVADKT